MTKLTKIIFKDHDDFLVKRSSIDGIGASDVGTIFGLNQYKSPLDLFYEKIGLKSSSIEDSPAMYRGRVLEEVVATKYWQYWDPEQPDMKILLDNVKWKKIVRRARKNNIIYINPDYPQLYCTPDYTYQDLLIEIKTVQGFAHAKWESPVHESYILQLQQQLMVTRKTKGEIALIKDATTLEVYPFDMNAELCETINIKTKDFWNKILMGRNFLADESLPMEERLHLVYAIEPDVEATLAYEATLKEAYSQQRQQNTIQADAEMLHVAKAYVAGRSAKKLTEEQMLWESNKIRKIMKDRDAGLIDFGTFGKIFYDAKAALQIKVNFD